MDYLGRPFGQMPRLLAVADFITKLHAICVCCGNIANISYRKTAQEGQVLLGEKDIYEPRCRKCYHQGEAVRARELTL
jgi:thymidine kinase